MGQQVDQVSRERSCRVALTIGAYSVKDIVTFKYISDLPGHATSRRFSSDARHMAKKSREMITTMLTSQISTWQFHSAWNITSGDPGTRSSVVDCRFVSSLLDCRSEIARNDSAELFNLRGSWARRDV